MTRFSRRRHIDSATGAVYSYYIFFTGKEQLGVRRQKKCFNRPDMSHFFANSTKK